MCSCVWGVRGKDFVYLERVFVRGIAAFTMGLFGWVFRAELKVLSLAQGSRVVR